MSLMNFGFSKAKRPANDKYDEQPPQKSLKRNHSSGPSNSGTHNFCTFSLASEPSAV